MYLLHTDLNVTKCELAFFVFSSKARIEKFYEVILHNIKRPHYTAINQMIFTILMNIFLYYSSIKEVSLIISPRMEQECHALKRLCPEM